jgi:hypothetical protein
MEHLIIDLKEKLILRKKNEIDRLKKYDSDKYKELHLISSGKIYELDQLIVFLNDMLIYHNQTKKIIQ